MKKILFISFLFLSLVARSQVVTRPLLYSKLDSLGLAKADTTHTHSPADILTDATHRFITDAERISWSLKIAPADTINLSNRINGKANFNSTSQKAQVPHAIGAVVFGHSIFNGSDATMKDSSAPYRLNNAIGGTIHNHAPPGATMSQISKIIEWQGLPTSDNQLRMWIAGTNDWTASRNFLKVKHYIHAARHFVINAVKDTLITAAQLTETGTWSSANLDTAFTFRTKGRQTTTLNDKTKFNCPADNFFIAFLTSANANVYSDSVEIRAGNVIVGTVNLSAQSDTTSQYVFVMPRIPFFNEGGITAPYDVDIYNRRSGKKMAIDYVGWMKAKEKQAPTLVFGTTYISAHAQSAGIGNSWFDSTNNALALDVDTLFSRLGYNVAFVDDNVGFNAETMTDDPNGADGIHPNNTGHRIIFEAALRKMQFVPTQQTALTQNDLVVGTPGVTMFQQLPVSTLNEPINIALESAPTAYQFKVLKFFSGDPEQDRTVFRNRWNNTNLDYLTARGDSSVVAAGKWSFSGRLGINMPDLSGPDLPRATLDMNDVGGANIFLGSDSYAFYHQIRTSFAGLDPANNRIDFWVHIGDGDTTHRSRLLSLKGDNVVQFPTYGAGVLTTDASGNISATNNTYFKYSDSAATLSAYQIGLNVRTAAIALKLSISDTAAMFNNYRAAINGNTAAIAVNTASIASNTTTIAGKADTATVNVLAKRVLYVTTQKTAVAANGIEIEIYRDTIKHSQHPFRANTSLRIPILLSCAATTNNKVFRLKINGTTVVQATLASATNVLYRYEFWMSNRNTLTTQIMGGDVQQGTNLGWNVAGTGSPQERSLDTSGDVIITATRQCTVGSELLALEQMDVVMCP